MCELRMFVRSPVFVTARPMAAAGPTRVLFLCTHNSARSQMAEGLLRHVAAERFIVASAGTEKTLVRPEAVAVMAELGIDISRHTSKTYQEFLGKVDVVVTVCDSAHQACPYFPGVKTRLHWPVADPSGVTGSEEDRLKAFRAARDQLREKVIEFSAAPPVRV